MFYKKLLFFLLSISFCLTALPATILAASISATGTYLSCSAFNKVYASGSAGQSSIRFNPSEVYLAVKNISLLSLAHHVVPNFTIDVIKQSETGFGLGFTNFRQLNSGSVKIADSCIKLDTSNLKIQNPSCNITGSISGIKVETYQNEKYNCIWKDQNLTLIATTLDVSNLLPGKYTLTVTGRVTGCSVTYGPATIVNKAGPDVDESRTTIQPSKCGEPTGSILNISVTSKDSLKYAWLNSAQQIVSTSLNLTNQPAGAYALRITDGSQCGTVYTSALVIPEINGITIDTSGVKVTGPNCSDNTGSITGIQVTGASKYQWTNANNTAADTTPNLQNAEPGTYILTVSNAFGCIKTTPPYKITAFPQIVFPSYPSMIASACANAGNGGISVAVDTLVKNLRWVNSAGQTIGTNAALLNVPMGTYQLYVTGKNGCERFYGSYNVPLIPQLTITAGSETIANDECSLKTGSIAGIQVTGGLPPYTYTWTDVNNHVISDSLNLTGLSEGSYTLNVNDASACGPVSATYNIQNLNNTILPPLVNDVRVCSPGNVFLKVNNPAAQYSYRLYASETIDTPLLEDTHGVFEIIVKTNATYYVSQFLGGCESSRTPVQVALGFTSADIASAFTPNGDGINDFWDINGLSSYPNAVVQVFTDYGQKVFESKGYSTPFDGTSNGKKLPSGVYYYIIKLSGNCNLLAGSLTIIR